MLFDYINRNNEFEHSFAKHNAEFAKERPHVEYLYRLFLQIKGYDLQLMREKPFRIVSAGLWFAGEYWKTSDLISQEEEIFYDYTKWFYINRLINTGTGGFARCERSPIFVQPRSKRTVRT